VRSSDGKWQREFTAATNMSSIDRAQRLRLFAIASSSSSWSSEFAFSAIFACLSTNQLDYANAAGEVRGLTLSAPSVPQAIVVAAVTTSRQRSSERRPLTFGFFFTNAL
jgi:hypothetical protein